MMKQAFSILLLVAGFTGVRAQQNYEVGLIPKELLIHANSVVRDEETSIEVKDMDKAVEQGKKAVTVLNTKGDENARVVIYYDKGDAVKSIRGVVYNEFGKQLTKFSGSDFSDVSV